MSSTTGSQNLLVNVFRPVYKFNTETQSFAPTLELAGVGYAGNTISVFNANIGDSADNVYVGSNAGNSYLDLRAARNNTTLGRNAGAALSNVSNSVYIGHSTGSNARNASNVIAIGAETGGNGISNIFVGNSSGGTGSNNVLVGHSATTNGGASNIMVGNGNTATGSGNLLIGNGISNGSANNLFQMGTLLYGDMNPDYQWLGIGTATPLGGARLTVGGDMYADGNITGGLVTSFGLNARSGAINNNSNTTNVIGGVKIEYGNITTLVGASQTFGDVIIDPLSGISNPGGTSNVIGGVTLSSGNICNAGFTSSASLFSAAESSNNIGGVTLSNGVILGTYGGAISNSGSSSNSIGGVTLSNGDVTIPGTLTAGSFDMSGGALSSSNLVVSGYIRNALTPSQLDISGGNISNSGVHTTTGLVGTYLRNAATGWTTDISGGNISNSGSNITNATVTRNLYAPSTTDVSAISYITMGTGSNGGVGGPCNLQFMWLRGGGSPGRYSGINFGNLNTQSFLTYNENGKLVIKYIGDLPSAQSQLDVCASIFTLTSGGLLGLGTSSPATTLDISSVQATRSILVTNNSTSGTTRILDGLMPNLPNAGKVQILLGKSTGASNYGAFNYTHVADGSANNYTGMVNSSGNGVIVTQAGNIGIGTTGPTARLDVSSGSSVTAIFRNQNNNGQAAITVIGNNGTDASGISLVHNQALQGFYSMNTLPFTFAIGNNTRRMTILGSNGNVGIGVTDPSYAIDVLSGDNKTAIFRHASSQAGIEVVGSGSATGRGIQLIHSAGGQGIYSDSTVTPMYFYNNGAVRMSILPNGNIGIGQPSPNYNLDVVGTVSLATSNYLFVPNANIPAAADGVVYFVGTAGSPNIGRMLIGNGSGWKFAMSKRVTSTTTDLVTFTDAGKVGIATDNPLTALDVSGSVRLGSPLDTGVNALLEIGGGAAFNGTGGTTALAIQHFNGGGYRHYVRSRHTSSLANWGNGIDFFTNNGATANASSGPGTGNILGLSITSAGVGVGTVAPVATLDVSTAANTPSINMTTWPRMPVNNTLLVKGYNAALAGNTVNFVTTVQAINTDLMTWTSNSAANGASFVIKKTGIWSINASFLQASTTYMWIDASTNDVSTGVWATNAGTPTITAANGGGTGVVGLNFTGYLPSNLGVYYKFRSASALNAQVSPIYTQITFLHETPLVAGNFPFN